ncbi:MAG: hypothetical protein HYS02_02445 [Candidatus Staskawiczbacteria bacterium]|nr:hypothetical protein [Candidatus Staskawiczbacteria bacterium]
MEFLKKTKEFLLNFFNLTRILSNVKNIAVVFLSFYLSGSNLDWRRLFIGIISLSFICSAIYIYNNLSDAKIDS